MNLMRTTRTDNLRAINRIDSIKRRKASEPAQQTVIHEELPQKPSRVEVHNIEPTTTTKSSLTQPNHLLEKSQEIFLPEALERTQKVQGTKVNIGEGVKQVVTKTVDAQEETGVEEAAKDAPRITEARYQEVAAFYRAAYQPLERLERTSIFA